MYSRQFHCRQNIDIYVLSSIPFCLITMATIGLCTQFNPVVPLPWLLWSVHSLRSYCNDPNALHTEEVMGEMG
jgi:hypothetical protein